MSGIDTDMRLHAEVPLLALLRLVHRGVALPAQVLRRRRRMDNRCVYDRAGRDAKATALQMLVDRTQHRPAQIMLLQQMAEVQDGGLIWCRSTAQVHPGETLQHG